MQSTQNSNFGPRKIGKHNVSPLGFGLMGMAHYRPKANETPESVEKEHFEILTKAADSGITFWDTSDVYGPFTNEEMVGKWFKQTGRRKEIFLCTKFANILDVATFTMTIRGDAQYVREACEASLKRLNTDYIDLYYQHRVDPKVRIEETVGAMAELVKEGKVKYLGLSECSSNTLRRAHKVHPIAAVQLEYSLFSLDIEREEIGLKKTCDELGIAIVAYSPLGRGILTGQIQTRKDLEGDIRLMFPRFSEENFDNNIKLVHKVQDLAKKKGCTPGQLALAWLLKQGENIIPIPGTRRMKNFEENCGALEVNLSKEEVDEIREIAEKAEVKGERYPERFMGACFFESI